MNQTPTATFLSEPGNSGAPLIGVARMASESEHSQLRNDVDYRWIACRSTLNRVNGKRVAFEWSINPYRGCEFGCAYCYARYTHEYMNHEDPMDFERIIYLKRHAAEWLQRELARGKCAEGETIVIGGATDPYQPAEKKYQITRSVLQKLAGFSGYKVGIITKSDLIQRDVDLLRTVAKKHVLTVSVTITTTDMSLARKLEPRAPTPRRRLETIKLLNDYGISSGLSLAPILPAITDSPENLESVVKSASEAGAAFLHWQVLFLASCSKKRFEPFLRDEFPHLSRLYNEFYSNGIHAPDAYRRTIKARMNEILERYGLDSRSVALKKRQASPSIQKNEWQPELFSNQIDI